MEKKRKSIAEIVVNIVIVVGILVFLYFLIAPNIITPCGGSGSKTQEISNLKNLVGIYISGQTDKKSTPRSMGHRFWLALFVGDPDLINGGVKIENTFASPMQAGNLLSPEDKECLDKEDIIEEFDKMVNTALGGWDRLTNKDNLYTSYAGPASRRVFTDKTTKGIVGCTGSRDGIGFFPDGFATVNSSQGSEFKTYEELAEKYPNEWTGKEEEPNWNSALLKTVINIEPSTETSKSEGR